MSISDRARYGIKIITGGISRQEIQAIANSVDAGSKIKYQYDRYRTDGPNVKTGTILKKYPYFALVQAGHTREAVLWVDLILRGGATK